MSDHDQFSTNYVLFKRKKTKTKHVNQVISSFIQLLKKNKKIHSWQTGITNINNNPIKETLGTQISQTWQLR